MKKVLRTITAVAVLVLVMCSSSTATITEPTITATVADTNTMTLLIEGVNLPKGAVFMGKPGGGVHRLTKISDSSTIIEAQLRTAESGTYLVGIAESVDQLWMSTVTIGENLITLEAQVTALQAQAAALQSQVSTNTSNISANQSQVSTNTSNISANQSQVSTNTSSISANQTLTQNHINNTGNAHSHDSRYVRHSGTTMRAISGMVNSNGSILTGEGFTISKGGTGTYAINYNSGFGAIAPPVISPLEYMLVRWNSVGTNSCSFTLQDAAGNPRDDEFSFAVLGR